MTHAQLKRQAGSQTYCLSEGIKCSGPSALILQYLYCLHIQVCGSLYAGKSACYTVRLLPGSNVASCIAGREADKMRVVHAFQGQLPDDSRPERIAAVVPLRPEPPEPWRTS